MTVPSLPFEDEDLPLFTVGQVSGMLEVQQACLRRLDEFGVVRPSRSDGGQRRYSRREVVTVQYVVRLTSQGVTLAGIRRILELEAQVAELEQECARPGGSGTMSGRAAAWTGPAPRGCSSMAERQLPKLIVRVRFPSPAPISRPRSGYESRTWALIVP